MLLNFFANFFGFFRNLLVGLRSRRPDCVLIEVRGNLPAFERRVGFLRRRLTPGERPLSLEGVRERLRLLSANAGRGRLPGVVLRVRNLQAGWASIEELRRELFLYRERGGKVVAYLVEGTTASYYLASAADEVFATPLATLDVTGVRTSLTFLKDALSRVGVEAEVVAVSPYKSAYDRFARTDFSEESREQVERLLDRRYEELVEAISTGRNLPPEEVERKIDRAPYPAREAVREGLLDGALYEDELPGRLGGERARLAGWNVAKKSLKRPYRKRSRKKVGVVALSGLIARGRSRNVPLPIPLVGGEQAGDETLVGALRAAERNRRVGSILFYVDSGGGDALASDLIWREVARIKEKKPVVVLMGNVAASGGYYVGAAADHIVASRSTVTGSIGVISLRPVAAKLYENLGLNPVSVERGAHSGLLDPARRPTSDELETLRAQILSVYGEFKERVESGRGIETGRLETIAGGRVWTGAEARDLGLVDEIGGFREAFEQARRLGGVEKDGPEALVKVRSPGGESPPPSEGSAAEGSAAALEALGGLQKLGDELLKTRTLAVLPFEMP